MAYKVNSFNYVHIRNSIFRNGVAATSKAYGIDKTTLRYIKECSTFDEYRQYVAKKSREQYERRIERQKKRMFGNGLHFDGRVTLNAKQKEEPKNRPFETTPELGMAKTIVTDVKEHETPRDLFVAAEKTEQPKPKASRIPTNKKYQDFTAEMYEIAVEMARNGAFKDEIAKRIGYPNVTLYTYYLNKNVVYKEGIDRAYEEGREKYLQRLVEKQTTARKASAAKSQNKNNTTENTTEKKTEGLTPYERGLRTGAEKRGITVEEYLQLRKENIRKGRWGDHKKKENETAETYEELAERQKEEAKKKFMMEELLNQGKQMVNVVEEKTDAENSTGTKIENKEQPEEQVRKGENIEDKMATIEKCVSELPELIQKTVDKDMSYEPVRSKVSKPMFTETKTVVVSNDAEDVVRSEEKHTGKNVLATTECKPEGLEKRETVLPSRESTARGWNSFLISTGQAIKVIAIGVLFILLALGASMVIKAFNANDNASHINWDSCEYSSTSWGTSVVKCDTIK